MSYGSEYLDETAYEREQAEAWYEIAEGMAIGMASQGLWETREGKTLSVKEMTTSHIKNCINMLNRNNSPFADIYVPMFEKELAERKKMKDLINRQEVILHLQRTLDATNQNNPYNEGFCEGLEFAISFVTGLKSAEGKKE